MLIQCDGILIQRILRVCLCYVAVSTEQLELSVLHRPETPSSNVNKRTLRHFYHFLLLRHQSLLLTRESIGSCTQVTIIGNTLEKPRTHITHNLYSVYGGKVLVGTLTLHSRWRSVFLGRMEEISDIPFHICHADIIIIYKMESNIYSLPGTIPRKNLY